MDKVDEFNAYRTKMTRKLMAENNKVLKRIFNLDTNAFVEGAIDKKTKEMLGLIASLVLRCEECIQYHLETCHKEGISREQVVEIMSIGTLIGGTIVIPYIRKAHEYWEILEKK